MTPTHYISYEGGGWEEWLTTLPVYYKFLEDKVKYCKKTEAVACKLGNVTFHALAFDNPAKGWGSFPRWDCINGWTTTIKEAEEMNKSV